MSTTVYARIGGAGRLTQKFSVIGIGALLLTISACASGSESPSGVASDCEPAHDIETLEEGKLAVATQTIMPFGGLADGELTGMDGAVVGAIAELECLEIVPSLLDSSGVIPSVTSGKVDLGMGDWYRTPERLEELKMSDAMYNDQYGFISEDGVDNFEDLKSMKVGAPAGYSFSDSLQDYLGGQLRLYSKADDLYQDLRTGRIDVAADSAGSGDYNAGDDFTAVIPIEIPTEMGDSFDPTTSGLPVDPDNPDLLDAINEDLKTLRDNGELAKFAEDNGLPEEAVDVG